MSALAKRCAPAPDLLEVFTSRVETWAYWVAIGDEDLHDAVDYMQAEANRYGLVGNDQDAVQTIMAGWFGRDAEDILASWRVHS